MRNGPKIVLVLVFVVGIFLLSLHTTHGQDSSKPCKRGLKVATWNVAAINNNPFEYWITYPDPKYIELMNGVQEFVSTPGDMDVAVHKVFTDEMAKQLFADMASKNIEGLAQVEKRWSEEYRDRKIISGFLKDKALGKKRLASMPDRVTNTIHTADGGTVLRPTVINCVEQNIPSLDAWWRQWRDFMFVNMVTTGGGKGKPPKPSLPFDMLQPILQSKYPEITSDEQAVSIPLQALCLAIFDAILVHMMHYVAASSWQPIRKTICEALNRHKNEKVKAILKSTYQDSHVIMLQETASAFVGDLRDDAVLSEKYLILSPAGASPKRDQNSLILLDKKVFVADSVTEVTDKILKYDSVKAVSSPGDVLAVTATTTGFKHLFMVSFHGDTNGLATKPLMKAILEAMQKEYYDMSYIRPMLLIGMDGNTYKLHNEHFQGVTDFQTVLAANGLSSVWGDTPDPLSPTTCNARTYLQPQLNKAVSKKDTFTKGDVNLKDWIVFYTKDFVPVNGSTMRDNTGLARYTNEMVYPTLDFPSDHAVVATTLAAVGSSDCLFH